MQGIIRALYDAVSQSNLELINNLLNFIEANPDSYQLDYETGLISQHSRSGDNLLFALVNVEDKDVIDTVITRMIEEEKTISRHSSQSIFNQLKLGKGILYEAVKHNNEILLNHLLRSPLINIDLLNKPKTLSKKTITALQLAVELNRENLCYLLLDPSIRAHDEARSTPAADINKQNSNGETVLHFAARYGRSTLIDNFLFKFDADPFPPAITRSKTRSPLAVALEQGQTQVVRYLAERGFALYTTFDTEKFITLMKTLKASDEISEEDEGPEAPEINKPILLCGSSTRVCSQFNRAKIHYLHDENDMLFYLASHLDIRSMVNKIAKIRGLDIEDKAAGLREKMHTHLPDSIPSLRVLCQLVLKKIMTLEEHIDLIVELYNKEGLIDDIHLSLLKQIWFDEFITEPTKLDLLPKAISNRLALITETTKKEMSAEVCLSPKAQLQILNNHIQQIDNLIQALESIDFYDPELIKRYRAKIGILATLGVAIPTIALTLFIATLIAMKMPKLDPGSNYIGIIDISLAVTVTALLLLTAVTLAFAIINLRRYRELDPTSPEAISLRELAKVYNVFDAESPFSRLSQMLQQTHEELHKGADYSSDVADDEKANHSLLLAIMLKNPDATLADIITALQEHQEYVGTAKSYLSNAIENSETTSVSTITRTYNQRFFQGDKLEKRNRKTPIASGDVESGRFFTSPEEDAIAVYDEEPSEGSERYESSETTPFLSTL